MKTSVLVFPFDLFGGAGTGEGAALLADELREVLADNRREQTSTNARRYSPHVRIKEWSFETLDELTGWRQAARSAVRPVLRAGDFLLWLGGNHLATLPVLEEIARLDGSSVVVQFDAHLDIHRFSDCTSELSHGNFLLHAVEPLPTLLNVGHRELLIPESDIASTFALAVKAETWADDLASLGTICQRADRVFFDLDCDVLDPAYFPAVTTPVPFGLTPRELLRAMLALWSPKVAGVFVSEFAPARDQGDRSLALLVWLIERLLLQRYPAE